MQRRLPKPPTSPMNAAIPSSSVLLVLPIYQTLSLNNPKSHSTRETQSANLLELKKSRYTKHPQNKKNKKKLFASLKSSSKSRWNQNHVPRGSYIEQAASCRAPEDSKQMIAFCKLQSCPSLHYAIGSTLPVVTAVTTNQQTSWKRSKAY